MPLSPVKSDKLTIPLSLSLGLFLVSLEVSIVATSLVAISDDLKGFDKSSWIVTAYLLTYTGKTLLCS